MSGGRPPGTKTKKSAPPFNDVEDATFEDITNKSNEPPV